MARCQTGKVSWENTLAVRRVSEKALGGKELDMFKKQQEDRLGHGTRGELGSGASSGGLHRLGLGVWISVSM